MILMNFLGFSEPANSVSRLEGLAPLVSGWRTLGHREERGAIRGENWLKEDRTQSPTQFQKRSFVRRKDSGNQLLYRRRTVALTLFTVLGENLLLKIR